MITNAGRTETEMIMGIWPSAGPNPHDHRKVRQARPTADRQTSHGNRTRPGSHAAWERQIPVGPRSAPAQDTAGLAGGDPRPGKARRVRSGREQAGEGTAARVAPVSGALVTPSHEIASPQRLPRFQRTDNPRFHYSDAP